MRLWKARTADPLEGFLPLSDDDWPVQVADRWPAGRLRRSAMQAYDELAGRGEIRPQGVQRASGGAVVVRYRAQIPEAWVHELLARTEQEMTGGAF